MGTNSRVGRSYSVPRTTYEGLAAVNTYDGRHFIIHREDEPIRMTDRRFRLESTKSLEEVIKEFRLSELVDFKKI
jgi:hypothetical protein